MIIPLFIILCTLMIACLNIEKKQYTAPSFTFCLSFCFSCAWAVVYRDQWDLQLHWNTFCVLLGGVTVFMLFSYATKLFLRKTSPRFQLAKKEHDVVKEICIDKTFLVLIVLVETFSVLFTLYEIMNAAGTTNISKALVFYNNTTKFTTDIVVFRHAGLLHLFWAFVDAMGFWISYIVANNIIAKKKTPWLEIIILIVSCVNNFFRGARTTAICKILSAICIYVILLRRNSKNKEKAVKTSFIIKLIVLAILFMVAFKSLGGLLGRTIATTGTDYVAMYCGSEIKNLDTFLQEPRQEIDSILDSQTFYVLMRFIKPKLGITDKTLPILQVRFVHGIMLANVYTTFYQFIYDFGYVGVVVLTGLMAIITQSIYEFSISNLLKRKPLISLVAYGNIYPSLVFSFFSNKFYERNFSIEFVRMIIFWYLFNFIFIKVRFKLGKRRNKD